MNFSFSELFSYFGGTLGLILMFVILTFMKGKATVKNSLVLFLLFGSLIVIIGAITYSGKVLSLPFLLRIDSPLHYLIGPVCFFYTLASFKSDFRFRKIQLLNLLPFFINIIEFIPFYFSSSSYKIDYYNQLNSAGSVILPWHYLFKTISTSGYFIVQLYVFYRYKSNKGITSTPPAYLVSWFLVFFAGQAVMLGGLIIDQFTSVHLFDDPYRYSITIETFYLYVVSIALLFYPSILYGNLSAEITAKDKYVGSTLTNNDKVAILENFVAYMQSDSKPFLRPKLSLIEVAGLLGLSTKHLSQVINERTTLNFNEYLNSLRVEEAKKILSSPEFMKLTIDAIALKAGFNSKSPFYAAFKQFTGMTPKKFVDLQKAKT